MYSFSSRHFTGKESTLREKVADEIGPQTDAKYLIGQPDLESTRSTSRMAYGLDWLETCESGRIQTACTEAICSKRGAGAYFTGQE